MRYCTWVSLDGLRSRTEILSISSPDRYLNLGAVTGISSWSFTVNLITVHHRHRLHYVESVCSRTAHSDVAQNSFSETDNTCHKYRSCLTYSVQWSTSWEAQVENKFLTFNASRMFIAVFTEPATYSHILMPYFFNVFYTLILYPHIRIGLSGDPFISGFPTVHVSHASFVLATYTIHSILPDTVTLKIHVWCRPRWLRGQRRILPSTAPIWIEVSISFRTLTYAAFLCFVVLCRKVVTLRWADPTSLHFYQMWKRFIVSAVN